MGILITYGLAWSLGSCGTPTTTSTPATPTPLYNVHGFGSGLGVRHTLDDGSGNTVQLEATSYKSNVHVTAPTNVPTDQRYDVVNLRITNKGPSASAFDWYGSCSLLSRPSGRAGPAIGVITAAGPGFPNGVVTIKPGTTVEGWVAFNVRAASQVEEFVVTAGAPFSPRGAGWDVLPPPPSPGGS